MNQSHFEAKKEEEEKKIILADKKIKSKIHFWLALSFFCVLISLLLIFVIFTFNKQEGNKRKFSSEEKENSSVLDENSGEPRFIDGVYVKKGEENIFPLALMIDNHSEARPPSGLEKANLVFEAEAEGGITRYLAIFASQDEISELGPIRSARPYFVDWVREFSALYVHVGGSPEALVKIKQDNIFDINEFYNEKYFWRSDYFNRPHNVFSSSKKLRDYIRNKNLEEGKFFSWKFKDDQIKKELPLSGKISIKFKLDAYALDWVFDRENNNYIRYQNKNPHYTRSGEIISAKNIIIEYIDAKEIDDKLRLKMEVVGEGKALVCFDGKCREAHWEKKTKGARTRYYIDGEEVVFNRGTSWIEILRPEIEVSIN